MIDLQSVLFVNNFKIRGCRLCRVVKPLSSYHCGWGSNHSLFSLTLLNNAGFPVYSGSPCIIKHWIHEGWPSLDFLADKCLLRELSSIIIFIIIFIMYLKYILRCVKRSAICHILIGQTIYYTRSEIENSLVHWQVTFEKKIEACRCKA